MKVIEKEVKYTRKKLVPEKLNCSGCEDNFYNGNNPHGTKECWKFKGAKIIPRKEVHINQVPPWNQKPELRMNCYRKKQYCYVDGDRKC